MSFSPFKNLPIKQKLVLLLLGITFVTLFLFALTSVFTQIKTMRDELVENKSILAESIAELSTAAISFSDQASATEILRTLHADSDLESAVIYTEFNDIFARYHSQPVQSGVYLPVLLKYDELSFIYRDGKYKLELFRPIMLEEKRIGTLYMLSNTDRMVGHIKRSIMLLVGSIGILLAAVLLVSGWLQRLITRPVSRLASTVRDITERGDYSLKVEQGARDEIGQLIEDFNTMLLAIHERDEELRKHRQNLELLVEERTKELRTKRDEALAAAKAKSEFLANMSHEIRTPLNGVIGVLSLLRDATMTEEFRRLLDTATRSADSLLLIINDILDFSKIDAGKITFESIVFDLREVMEETSELFIDTLNLKQLDLTCYVPTDLPCKVKGDPTRLRQILTNLLSNAVKFTEQGEVKLQVSVVNRDECYQELLFTVEDTGIGIDEKVIGKLFDKFTQADGSTTRKYGGTGLGLSVCKQLVEKQGGTIGLNSRLGHGSMFWFTLTLEIVEETYPLIPYSKLKGKTFLVIEDNQNNCMILEQYLNFCDAEVHCYNSPETALRILVDLVERGDGVDMVLIDYTLPKMNGVQLATEIRARLGDKTPELLLMGTGTFSRAQLEKIGVGGLLLKPIRQHELYSVLAHMPVPEKARPKESQPKIKSKYPELHGKVLLVDDEPINQRIGLAILKKFGLMTEVASNGYEAVQLTAENDYSVVLMDIQMPEMSGFEATQLIRARELAEGKTRTVIIAMTANAMESTRQRCFDVGMDDFFTKPIKPDSLAERLKPWLFGQEPEGTGPAPPSGQDELPASEREEVFSLNTAMVFVGGDEELFRELVNLFIERNDSMLSRIDDAVVSGVPDQLRDAAHAYKGAVNHFACEQVRDLAFRLEMMGKEGNLSGAEETFGDLKREAAVLIRALQAYQASFSH